MCHHFGIFSPIRKPIYASHQFIAALTTMEEEKDGHSVTRKPNGDDDGCWIPAAYSLEAGNMYVPFNSLGFDNFSGPDIQGVFHSFPPDLNCLPDSRADGDLINSMTEKSEFCSRSEMLYPNMSLRELSYGIDGSNVVHVDCLMDTDVTSTGYGRSELHMNFTPPRCETTTGYPIKEHGAKAKSSRFSRSNMRGDFSSTNCSTYLLPLVDNFGAIGNKNDINAITPSFSSPQKVDRDFLTLGTGSGTEIRSNSNFSTGEIACKLEEVSGNLVEVSGNPVEVSSHCNFSTVRHIPMNPSNLSQSMGKDGRIRTSTGGPNFCTREIAPKLEDSSARHCPVNPLELTQLMSRAGRNRTSAGGWSSSEYSLASRMPTYSEGGLNGDTGFRLNSIPSSSLQTPQANALSIFLQRCFTSEFDSTPLSFPFGSTLISEPKSGAKPELTTTKYLASQPILWQHDYFRENCTKISSESSRNCPSHRHNLTSISNVQLGGGSQSSADAHFPQSIRPTRRLNTHNFEPVEALGNNFFPDRNGFQISKSVIVQSAASGPLPKRIGLQPSITTRTARGAPPAAQFNSIRPPASAGQYKHGVPAQLAKDLPRVDNYNDQVIPVAKSDVRPQSSPIASHPHLKRKGTENPASARSSQQRKTVPQPIVHNSTPSQRHRIQATPIPIPGTVHVPPAPLHVKWKGFNDEPLEPTGEKCLLCKRDLSFTAEGLVFQPSAPPHVAVLPCGHTFHEHCLQIIAPEDQLTTPPCIPCAIGET